MQQRVRAAVVGHVEWVTFLPVDRAPAPGRILEAAGSWDEPAGGGGMAAAELARLAGGCTLYTALGHDVLGEASRERLEALGVAVRASVREEPHRRAITLLDPTGERTIVVVGPAQQAEGADALDTTDLDQADVVYFCKGDAAMVRAARRARVLVATARALPVLQEAGVRLDVLIRSARDEGERYAPGDLDPEPALVVETDGPRGGTWRGADGSSGSWRAAALPGPLEDAYGAGDCFAAALAYGLGCGVAVDEALQLAAERAAVALCRRGAHGGP